MRPGNNELVVYSGDEYSANRPIDFTLVRETLRREWRFPAFGCLIGLVLAIGYLFAVPPLYKSTARILIDRSVNRYLQTNKIVDEPTFDEQELESQVNILMSESIVGPVVRSLDLVNDEEFVGPPNTLLERILNVVSPKQIITESKGQDNGQNNSGASDADDVLGRTVIEAFLKKLTVNREVANVINVTFASEDPKKAARIANAIADVYLATGSESKYKSTRLASQWLEDRLMKLRAQTIEADRALQDYKIANNLINNDRQLLNAEQLSLNTQLAGARVAAAEAKERLDRIRHAMSQGDASATVTDVLSNSVIVKLRSQYTDLSAKAAEIESRVGRGHAAVAKIYEQMDEMRSLIRAEEERIAGSYVSEYQIAKARETELSASVANLLGVAGASSQAQVKMRELESAADTLRSLYNSFLQKFKELDTVPSNTVLVQDARIITRASPPLHSEGVKKSMAVVAGSIMLGLFLGAGAAMAREWAADVFRTPRLVEQVTDAHCVVLPSISPKREQSGSFLRGKQTKPIEEFALDSPYSRFTETLRSVKALISAAQCVDDVKVIGIVSSVANEGKTTIAANLAALMVASSGARTLVIDGDIHMRLLSARLAPEAREGLIESLRDPSRLSSFVCKRERSGLDVLPCVLPARLPNAAELLGSRQMEELLANARNMYDYVIIEIAPIMSVTDIKMIERFIDRFIFIVEWGQTSRNLVLEALGKVGNIRERLIGIVLNKADPESLRRIEAYKGNRFRSYYQEA
jgi:succinoglycan biosynthesis transport protein ExoP